MDQSFSLSLGGLCTDKPKFNPFYAVYSETDTSLRFYKNKVNIGDTLTTSEGTQIEATKVYEAHESDVYTGDVNALTTTTPWFENIDKTTKNSS